MSLNESIVEDAALEWFGEQSRVAPTLIPAFSQGEKEEDGDVVLVGRLREAIRRLTPAIPEEASACASHADRRATLANSATVQTRREMTP
jgi:hypothetical protein